MARTYIDAHGYRRFSDSGKLVSQWIGEKKLGRKIRSGEVVHHKNRDKLDNHPDNIWVFTGRKGYKKHDRTHRSDKKFTGEW